MAESNYLERLSGLVTTEAEKLPGGYSRLAELMGLSSQAVSKWMRGKISGEISDSSVYALAKQIGRSYESLQSYLRTGEWLSDEPQLTLEERVSRLEKELKQLKDQSDESLAMAPDWSMPILSRAMQDAIAAIGEDWRDDATIKSLHSTFTRSTDKRGLGWRTSLMDIKRLRSILFGAIEATASDDPLISDIMGAYTGDPQKWTTTYVVALAEGKADYQSPINRNGKPN